MMKYLLKFSQLLCVTILVSACAGRANRNPIFVSPERYNGNLVRLCGYIDGPNLFESRDRRNLANTAGISIISRGPLRQSFRGNACVEGRLEFFGCESDVCNGAAFEYAIRIQRVMR